MTLQSVMDMSYQQQVLCFEFIQVAIGMKESLSAVLIEEDWAYLFEFCKRQALIGVGFTAVEKLHRKGESCPQGLRMKWMSLALRIENLNDKLSRQCTEVVGRYGQDGLYACVLKGQGNLLNYPEDLGVRRMPGDIDVWCMAPCCGLVIPVLDGGRSQIGKLCHGRKAVMEYVMMQHRRSGGKEQPHIRYNHIEAPTLEGTEIEVHYRPSFCRNLLRNIRLQRWFASHADECMKHNTPMGFSVPTASVNVVYQMTHLFSHYFDEGLGLRQLMDYFFTLKAWHNDVAECWSRQSQLGMWCEGLGVPVMSAEEIMCTLRSFGMGKFAGAVMWVLHEVFAMPVQYYICQPDGHEGRKMLSEIMQGGNFGQYDERGKAMKQGGMVKHGMWKFLRIMRLVPSYPGEALWEPVFRVYHWLWRQVQ